MMQLPDSCSPAVLGKGSHGRAVNKLLFLLDPQATDTRAGPTGIILDEDFGDVGVRTLERLQIELGIEATGQFDPETRNALYKSRGVDFDVILCRGGKELGITVFEQLRGPTQYWGPGIEPTTDKAEADRRFEAEWGIGLKWVET